MQNHNGYTIYVVDTETTGLESEIHDVIELSMLRLIFDESGETIQEQKTWHLKALNPLTIQDDALAINNHKREDILHLTKYGKETYKEPSDVLIEIELWMIEDNVSSMDRIFVGQNPYFDIGFLKELWKRMNTSDTFPFELENNNRTIDTKQIAVLIDLCTGKRRLKYNLTALIKAFGVKGGKMHGAAVDALCTSDLLIEMLKPLRPIIKDKFAGAYPNES